MRNTPYKATQKVKADFGIYAQDAWTMKRLTLNYGGRFDHFNSEVPAQYSAPTAWLPFVRDFAAIENVPNWNDWAIRLAGSYDLFGTGKTALKGNVSKYMASEAAAYAATFNPMGLPAETRAMDRFRWQPDDLRRQRQHPVQRSRGRHPELRPGRGHEPARPDLNAATTGSIRCPCSTS